MLRMSRNILSSSSNESEELVQCLSDDSSFEVSVHRYTCPICQETESSLDYASVMDFLECGHDVCRNCLRKSVMLHCQRCPVCNILLNDLERFRGTVNCTEWIEVEKDKLWREGMCSGIKCGNPLCVGIATFEEGMQAPHQINCAKNCGDTSCGRCRDPWTPQHLCEDLLEEERRARRLEEDPRARRLEEYLRARQFEVDWRARLRERQCVLGYLSLPWWLFVAPVVRAIHRNLFDLVVMRAIRNRPYDFVLPGYLATMAALDHKDQDAPIAF